MKSIGWILVACLLAVSPADAGVIAQLEGPDLNEVQMLGFEIERESEVSIDAVGIPSDGRVASFFDRLFGSRDDEESPRMSVYAWILDSGTRQPVWVMNSDTTKSISDSLAAAETTVRLQPGRYELYLASTHRRVRQNSEPDDEPSFWNLFSDNERKLEDLLEDLSQCRVTLRIDGMSADRISRFEPDGLWDDALVAVQRIGNSQLEIRGIEVSQPATVRLYGSFEHLSGDDQPADFAWIVDETSRDVVWRGDRRKSQPAGGAAKNRLIDAELSLEPGRYLLYVGTDNSHAYGAFNSSPPHDPLNWGLTVRAGSQASADSIRTFEPAPAGAALIDFSKAGSDSNLESPFTMKQDGKVHLRALGEYSGGEFYDRAWITDAASGKRVWTMTGANTMAAGGAAKNRMFDGLVTLPQGEYVLHYASDGSHAYQDWNSATPFEPEAWGVVLRPGPS